MPSLEQFNEYVMALAYHDWYYDYSDDGSVYRAGRDKQEKLSNQAKSHAVYAAAMSAWSKYVHTNDRTDAHKDIRDAAIRALREQLETANV